MSRRLKAKGFKEIARELGCSMGLVQASVYRQGPQVGLPDAWTPAPGRLRAEEREEILLGLARGEAMAAIARNLGRATSTISREVAAQRRTSPLRGLDGSLSGGGGSPATKPAMLAQPPLVRELRRELARCLRSGRRARRHQGRVETRGKVPDMVMIGERPAEIEDRAVPGHRGSQWGCQAAREWLGGAVSPGSVVAQEGPEDVDAAAGEGDDGFVVSAVLGTCLEVVVPVGSGPDHARLR